MQKNNTSKTYGNMHKNLLESICFCLFAFVVHMFVYLLHMLGQYPGLGLQPRVEAPTDILKVAVPGKDSQTLLHRPHRMIMMVIMIMIIMMTNDYN